MTGHHDSAWIHSKPDRPNRHQYVHVHLKHKRTATTTSIGLTISIPRTVHILDDHSGRSAHSLDMILPSGHQHIITHIAILHEPTDLPCTILVA